MNKTKLATVQLSGEEGNAFAIIGRVTKALKRAGHEEIAKEYQTKALAAESYDALLRYTMSIVDVS